MARSGILEIISLSCYFPDSFAKINSVVHLKIFMMKGYKFMKESKTLKTLMSEFLLMQSKLEHEVSALESLIKIAKNQAENEDSELIHLMDALQNKAENIKNIVFEMTEN